MQTLGRGTRGKKWISQKGNLFGSIFFPLKKEYPSFDEFSFINPVIVFDVVKSFCVNCNLALKWPNDILLNQKKISGILQEIVKKKNLYYLIIGIGINLSSNPKINNVKTTNVLNETKIKINRDIAVQKIILSYESFFFNLHKYKFQKYRDKANFLSIKNSELK